MWKVCAIFRFNVKNRASRSPYPITDVEELSDMDGCQRQTGKVVSFELHRHSPLCLVVINATTKRHFTTLLYCKPATSEYYHIRLEKLVIISVPGILHSILKDFKLLQLRRKIRNLEHLHNILCGNWVNIVV